MMLLCPYHIYMCVCVSDEECVYVCDMMQSMCGLDLCFFLCQSPQHNDCCWRHHLQLMDTAELKCFKL